jgi:hypothetical protein
MAADGKPIVSLFVISGIMMLIRKVLNLSFVSYDAITCTMFFDCRFQLFLVNSGIKIQKQSGQFRDWSSPLLSGIMRLIRVVISYDVIIFNAFFLGRF